MVTLAYQLRVMKLSINRLLWPWLKRIRREKKHQSPSAFMRVVYCSPRQVALITSRHNNTDNVWPMDWHIPLSLNPKLYGIAVTKSSFGAELIRKSGVFVVNFVPATWDEVILKCGMKVPH